MKRTLVSIILFLIVIATIIFGIITKKDNNNSNLTKVKVAEVAHSIFYAPQYAAISEGYFKEEGIDIDLTLTPGADAVMSSVLSGDVNIWKTVTIATIEHIIIKNVNILPKILDINLIVCIYLGILSSYIFLIPLFLCITHAYSLA